MVYYRYLYKNMGELSPNEGLVYSALLSHSLMSIHECFDLDGGFNVENAKAMVRAALEESGKELIDYSPISTRKLTKMLGMTENTVRKIRHSLEHEHLLIDADSIYCPLELLELGYLDISPDTKLKGRQLTFYGLLKERSRLYNGIIDTWASKLAEAAGTTKSSIHKMIAELEAKDYVERLDNGKLKIN